MNTVPLSPLTRIRTTLDRLAGPQSGLCALILLIARAYLFYVFFRSGLTKLHDWPTTVLLFSEEYKVPLLPPALAAALGTFGELVFPSLMLIGIVPRLARRGCSSSTWSRSARTGPACRRRRWSFTSCGAC